MVVGLNLRKNERLALMVTAPDALSALRNFCAPGISGWLEVSDRAEWDLFAEWVDLTLRVL
jgi:hypothetical protein